MSELKMTIRKDELIKGATERTKMFWHDYVQQYYPIITFVCNYHDKYLIHLKNTLFL
jgi:hypothetical protein